MALDSNHKVQITVSIIALIAVLGAALISNWEKIVAKPTFEDGVALLDLGEFEQALDVFRPLARPGDAEAQMAMGKLYYTFKITDAYLYCAEILTRALLSQTGTVVKSTRSYDLVEGYPGPERGGDERGNRRGKHSRFQAFV